MNPHIRPTTGHCLLLSLLSFYTIFGRTTSDMRIIIKAFMLPKLYSPHAPINIEAYTQYLFSIPVFILGVYYTTARNIDTACSVYIQTACRAKTSVDVMRFWSLSGPTESRCIIYKPVLPPHHKLLCAD